MVAKFWLDPVALQRAGGFSRTELNEIAKLVDENREYLLESWYEFFGNCNSRSLRSRRHR
jgi:hypothetical protein